MNTTDKLGRTVLGLSVAIAVLCSAPTYATIVHSFDWSGTTDNQRWPQVPWGSWFQDNNASVHNLNDTGIIFTDVFARGPGIVEGQALIAEEFVDDDTNPGNDLNLSLLTISYDITRDSAVDISLSLCRCLGFYVYDIDGGTITGTNGDGLGLTPNGPENNFMNAYLDANPDTLTHYDVIVNQSGGEVSGLPNGKWRVFQDGGFLVEDFVAPREDPGNFPGGYVNGFDSWGFRAFGGGQWIVDNFTVRDEYFTIPEPTSLALLGLGVSAVVLRRRNRRS